MKLLAVTACAAGLAHTYMAAEALERAAVAKGHVIKVETQGASGIENRITPADVAAADAVILTKDIPIREVERFDSLKRFKVTTTGAIKSADKVIEAIEGSFN